MNNFLPVISVFYSFLIRFYPREFRLEFENELQGVFGALAHDNASRGAFSLVTFCLRELRDLPINLVRAHTEKNRLFRNSNFEAASFMLRGMFAFVALLIVYNTASMLLGIQTREAAMVFLSGRYLMLDNYYEALLILFGWLISGLLAGTVFAAILGERCRVSWLIVLGSIASLPWTAPWIASQLDLQWSLYQLQVGNVTTLDQDSVWVKVPVLLLLVLISVILVVTLFREQARFRMVLIVGLMVWLPGALSSDVFRPAPRFLPTEAEIKAQIPFVQFQMILLNMLAGAFMAGMLGLLLKDRRKIFWLSIVGAIFYPLVHYGYFQLMPLVFPSVVLATGVGYTTEEFILFGGIGSAAIGLLFSLPLILIFGWSRKGMPQQELG